MLFLLACSALGQLAAPPPAGRLADSVRPTAYRLELTIDPEQPSFGGSAEIDVALAAPTRRATWTVHRFGDDFESRYLADVAIRRYQIKNLESATHQRSIDSGADEIDVLIVADRRRDDCPRGAAPAPLWARSGCRILRLRAIRRAALDRAR